MEEFELVIVGAGSAGCIVANQLISKTNFKVLLIEAGPSDNNPVVKIPLGYGMTFYNKKLNLLCLIKRSEYMFLFLVNI